MSAPPIDSLKTIRNIDKRLVSYNIEMAEVTGGTFWKAYTPEQIDGTEKFPPVKDVKNITSIRELMQYYPPIDLYNERLRLLAKKTWHVLDSCIGNLGYQNLL